MQGTCSKIPTPMAAHGIFRRSSFFLGWLEYLVHFMWHLGGSSWVRDTPRWGGNHLCILPRNMICHQCGCVSSYKRAGYPQLGQGGMWQYPVVCGALILNRFRMLGPGAWLQYPAPCIKDPSSCMSGHANAWTYFDICHRRYISQTSMHECGYIYIYIY